MNKISNNKTEDKSMIQIRKEEHIDICLKQNIESLNTTNYFEHTKLVHHSLPNINYSEIDTSTNFLKHRFNWPIMITGMTGGIKRAELINQRLAELSSNYNIPMGIGSQRIDLSVRPSSNQYKNLKKKYKNLFLIGNLGIGQFYNLDVKKSVEYIKKASDSIGANAVAIHLNVLQELIQPEGNRNFKGLLEKLQTICSYSVVPIIIKEVGQGLSSHIYTKLKAAQIAAFDIAGNGGTSWAYIEGLRNDSQQEKSIGSTFRDFGIPTALALASAVNLQPHKHIIASGGIRNGLEIAKALAMGAKFCAIGLPFLKACLSSEKELDLQFLKFSRELKIAMLCSNSVKIDDLKNKVTPSDTFSAELQKLTPANNINYFNSEKYEKYIKPSNSHQTFS